MSFYRIGVPRSSTSWWRSCVAPPSYSSSIASEIDIVIEDKGGSEARLGINPIPAASCLICIILCRSVHCLAAPSLSQPRRLYRYRDAASSPIAPSISSSVPAPFAVSTSGALTVDRSAFLSWCRGVLRGPRASPATRAPAPPAADDSCHPFEEAATPLQLKLLLHSRGRATRRARRRRRRREEEEGGRLEDAGRGLP